MIKLVTQLLTANLFISTFYQLRPFYEKVTNGASKFSPFMYGIGVVLLILNLLTTYTMFLLINKNKVKRKKVIGISIITLTFTFVFLISFFDNHFLDCLTLSFPLLLINGLALIFAITHRQNETAVYEKK
jgi:tryptophan-rich sensory protein